MDGPGALGPCLTGRLDLDWTRDLTREKRASEASLEENFAPKANRICSFVQPFDPRYLYITTYVQDRPKLFLCNARMQSVYTQMHSHPLLRCPAHTSSPQGLHPLYTQVFSPIFVTDPSCLSPRCHTLRQTCPSRATWSAPSSQTLRS